MARSARKYHQTFSKDFGADPLAEASGAAKSVPAIEGDVGSEINVVILDERSNNNATIVRGQQEQAGDKLCTFD